MHGAELEWFRVELAVSATVEARNPAMIVVVDAVVAVAVVDSVVATTMVSLLHWIVALRKPISLDPNFVSPSAILFR